MELIEEQFYAEWYKRNVFNPSMTQSQPQRDKKRNHTLQIQRIGMFRQQKVEKNEKNIKEKVEKAEKVEAEKAEEVKEIKSSIASDTLA